MLKHLIQFLMMKVYLWKTNQRWYTATVNGFHQIWSIVTMSVNWFSTQIEAFFTTFIILKSYFEKQISKIDHCFEHLPCNKKHIFLFLSYFQPWGHKRFQHSTSASWQSNTFNDIRQALFGWMKTFYIIRYLTIYFCLLYSSWTTLTMRMRATTEKIVPIRHKIFLLLIWNLLSSLCLS